MYHAWVRFKWPGAQATSLEFHWQFSEFLVHRHTNFDSDWRGDPKQILEILKNCYSIEIPNGRCN